LFPPRSNTFSRVSILVAVILLAGIVGGVVWYTHSPAFTKVGVEIPQPVPFPHNFHINGLGLDCRYCHTGVDQSSFADIPPAETCMSCHSQVALESKALQPIRDSFANGTPVQWNRVNTPNYYLYCDHKNNDTNGVPCKTAHGRVDQMTTVVREKYFYMSTCMECHSDPAKFIRPVENVTEMGYVPSEDQVVLGSRLVREYNIKSSVQLNNCSICHR
jgi:hypothetical protein